MSEKDEVDRDGMRVRPAGEADRTAMVELCRAALGWKADDPNERFFEWKHELNPFGPSPAWLAETPDGELVGVRLLMRWRFVHRGAEWSAVRAVDTATRPDMQGRGIFTRLTTAALADLLAEGTDLVFNTPNDKSRPGYLKMGWQVVGDVPVGVRVRSATSLAALRGARVAAEKWSLPTDVGVTATDALSDDAALRRLLDACRPTDGIHTARSPEYLRWRYSFEDLHYRAVPLGSRVEDGLVIFRVRSRGTAVEATICEVLAPRPGAERSAIGWLLRRSGADYAIRCRTASSWRAGFAPVPKLGPVLTWRGVGRPEVPSMDDLSLSLGDVELF